MGKTDEVENALGCREEGRRKNVKEGKRYERGRRGWGMKRIWKSRSCKSKV